MEMIREYEEFLFHNYNETGVISAVFREPNKGLRLAQAVVPSDLDRYFSLDHLQTKDRLVLQHLNRWPCDQTMHALRTWPRT